VIADKAALDPAQVLCFGRSGTAWARISYCRTVLNEPEGAGASNSDLRSDPDSVSSIAELGRQLRLLRISAGVATLRELEARATASGDALPRSTAGNAESGKHLPGLEVIRAFVQACNGSAADVRRWQSAWQRLYMQRHGPPGRGQSAVVDRSSIPVDAPQFDTEHPTAHQASNPWRKPNVRERILAAETYLEERIEGQPRAIRRATGLLARAATGLGLAYAGGRKAPRAVMLLAGPPGVGKIELTKVIAQLLSVEIMHWRMSEFAEQHASDRLFGAPAGYVGYEAGGELTNVVRDHPYGVLVFEGIEKAHVGVLDRFFQIIEEGRIVDGRGGEADFSGSVLIFTTTIGISDQDDSASGRPPVDVSSDLLMVEDRVINSIQEHFAQRLGRPEFFSRLAHAIVVFDFLPVDASQDVARHMIDQIVKTVHDRFGVILEFSDEAIGFLIEYATRDLARGNRGIGNAIEAILINPLAREMVTDQPEPGQHWRITEIFADRGEWRPVVTKSE
jgi:hypothetical protein